MYQSSVPRSGCCALPVPLPPLMPKKTVHTLQMGRHSEHEMLFPSPLNRHSQKFEASPSLPHSSASLRVLEKAWRQTRKGMLGTIQVSTRVKGNQRDRKVFQRVLVGRYKLLLICFAGNHPPAPKVIHLSFTPFNMLDLTPEWSAGDWFWNSVTGGSGGWQSLLADCNTLSSGEILQLKRSVQNMPLNK